METLYDWGERLGKLVTDAGRKAIEAIGGVFEDDGILSMQNIVDFGTVMMISKLFPKDNDSAEEIELLSKQFSKFLPEYVKAKSAAGKLEAQNLEDLNDLVNYGVVTKRNPETGEILSRKQGGFGGRVGLEMEQLYGVKPQYETDEKGNVVIDPQTGNPKTVRTGRPGMTDIAGQSQREQQRLGDLARTATRVDQLAQSGQPLARKLRHMERTLSPEVQRTQGQVGRSFRGLLAAQDPTRLSGAEEAQVERGLGRMGLGIGRTSEMDKYRAAMTFGDALAAKQQRLGQALGQTGSVVPSLKSNINPGVVFGEGTTTMPTMPGQVSFGNTAAQAMAPVANIIQKSGAPQSNTGFARDVLLGGIGKGD